MFHFYSHWKHKKPLVFCFFRGYSSEKLVDNGLKHMKESMQKEIVYELRLQLIWLRATCIKM